MMPDFFDTVNLLLEAGMGLDLVLAEVVRKSKGPLSEEFLQTLEDMKLGKSRREAFYELQKRVPSDHKKFMVKGTLKVEIDLTNDHLAGQKLKQLEEFIKAFNSDQI